MAQPPSACTGPRRAQRIFCITAWGTTLFDAYRKDRLTHHGPLVAVLDIYDDFFAYGGGIYQHISGPKVGSHCVLVVGYSQSQNCWICKKLVGRRVGRGRLFSHRLRAVRHGRPVHPFL